MARSESRNRARGEKNIAFLCPDLRLAESEAIDVSVGPTHHTPHTLSVAGGPRVAARQRHLAAPRKRKRGVV